MAPFVGLDAKPGRSEACTAMLLKVRGGGVRVAREWIEVLFCSGNVSGKKRADVYGVRFVRRHR